MSTAIMALRVPSPSVLTPQAQQEDKGKRRPGELRWIIEFANRNTEGSGFAARLSGVWGKCARVSGPGSGRHPSFH